MTLPQDEFTRATEVCLADVRSFEVAPDTSYIGGKHTVFKLRCFGRGISSLGEGRACTLPSHSVAEAYGERWIKSGIEPAYQHTVGGAF